MSDLHDFKYLLPSGDSIVWHDLDQKLERVTPLNVTLLILILILGIVFAIFFKEVALKTAKSHVVLIFGALYITGFLTISYLQVKAILFEWYLVQGFTDHHVFQISGNRKKSIAVIPFNEIKEIRLVTYRSKKTGTFHFMMKDDLKPNWNNIGTKESFHPTFDKVLNSRQIYAALHKVWELNQIL